MKKTILIIERGEVRVCVCVYIYIYISIQGQRSKNIESIKGNLKCTLISVTHCNWVSKLMIINSSHLKANRNGLPHR